MANLDDSFYTGSDILNLKGMGPNYAKSFYKKGIYNLFDLLFDFPFKYLDQTKLTKISQVQPESSALLDVKITYTHPNFGSRVPFVKVSVQDDTGSLNLIFFNPYPSLLNRLLVGKRILVFGTVKHDHYGALSITQPTITYLENNDVVEPSKNLSPIYHAVEKVPQALIKRLIDSVLKNLRALPLPEILPKALNPFALTINEALDLAHYPFPLENNEKFILEKSKAFRRICYEELIAYQLTLLKVKRLNLKHNSIQIKDDITKINEFLKSLPFNLTQAQLRSFEEIKRDLAKSVPMMRLLHGDVGSGKTMVALLSAILVCSSNYQCVLLAPTELLAIQHYQKFEQMLKPFGIETRLLTSSVKGKARTKILEEIANGEAQVIVGTHSVFQAEVQYKNLALAIIDEQHRFGVDQRVALLQKAPQNITLHQLVMTATPIPRSLQLALFSELDVSTLDELPQGRKPIVTAVMSSEHKNQIVNRLKEVCAKGTQVYWVCPSIDENEDETASVKRSHKDLKKALPSLNIGLLHGQLASNDKNKIMKKFLDHEFDILVATTIIEVGVDVPNASIIVIEDADRLGLAQLHQLRGRVGRGSLESFCILVYNKGNETELGLKRLKIMRSTSDGFKIASEDLKMRGPGEVIGQKQAGFDIFRVADVNRDFDLIEQARKAALYLIDNDNKTCNSLIRRWFPKLELQLKSN